MTDTVSPEYALAVRALAAEERHGGGVDPIAAAEQALVRLREPLLLWFGRDGVHALFARAINRVAVVHPMLADASPIPLDGRHLDALARRMPPERGVTSRSRVKSGWGARSWSLCRSRFEGSQGVGRAASRRRSDPLAEFRKRARVVRFETGCQTG